MKKLALALVPLVLLPLAGCSGGGGSGHGDETVTLPEWTVPAGSESLKCVYQSLHNTTDLYVQRFSITQAPGGHHLLAFISTSTLPDGTEVDCASSQSMQSFRPLLVPTSTDGFDLPDGYVVRIPANAAIVYQSHYVNATTSEITTHDTVKIHFVPKSAGQTEVSTYINTTLNFTVPAGQTASKSLDCVAPRDMHVFSVQGHMHEWGTRFQLALGPDDASLATVYDISPWQVLYRDKPPASQFPFDAPLEIHQGDHLRMTCNWDNTQGATALTFPTEMCAAILWIYPASETIVCSE